MLQAFKRGLSAVVREVAPRSPEFGQVRLRVKACGICGTDLHPPGAQDADKEIPFGHESAGEIIELGEGVRGLSLGAQVVVESSTACGFCSACRNAEQELCEAMTGPWVSAGYGMAEEMVVPAVSVIPYSALTPEVACLQEPLGVAIDTVRVADLHMYNNLLIMGPGPIGLMIAALAKRMGVRRIFLSAYKRYAERCAVAKLFGVDEIVHPEETPIDKFAYGCKIDRIIATTPPATLGEAASLASKGAIITYIGLAAGGDSGKISLDGDGFHFKKLQLRASFASPALFGPLALAYLREKIIDGEKLITHLFPLSQTDKAIAVARDKQNSLKVIVKP